MFARKWNFPRACGAMDGKHVTIKQPPCTGAKYLNYKGTFSIVLFALVDADYNFIYTNIGTNGREHDAGIFRKSSLYEGLESGFIKLPPDHVILGDSAFPLKTYLMKPYSQKKTRGRTTIFNYRLSRARRIVENAFGILTWRFRVFLRPIEVKENTVDDIILAACSLHNWLRIFSPTYLTATCVDQEDANTGEIIPGLWRSEVHELISQQSSRASNNYKQEAENIRKKYVEYFCSEGAIQSQWKATGLTPEDVDECTDQGNNELYEDEDSNNSDFDESDEAL